VENGSAHGVGIYTAHVGSTSLSKRFCDSDTLLVCAVCDTSQPLVTDDQKELPAFVPSATQVQTKFPPRYAFQGRKYGNHEWKQESKEVRHVGSAVVVFEERCVVPVFTATVREQKTSGQGDHLVRHEETWVAGPQQIGRRRLVMPVDQEGLIKFGSVRNGRSGKTVWLPAMPKEDATAHERAVQRRLCHRRWQWMRGCARRAKSEMVEFG